MMALDALPLTPDWNETDAIDTFFRVLTQWVSEFLSVPTRPITVQLIRNGEDIAQTQQNWPPHAPVVCLSADSLRRDVVAHEIAHCLVPSPWLFFAEGIATWVGCVASGDCQHLLFSDDTLDGLLHRMDGDFTSPQALFGAIVDSPGILGADNFFRRDVRLAYAVAGSFCGFVMQRHPQFARHVATAPNQPPQTLLTQTTGCTLNHLESEWRRQIRSGTDV